MYGLSQYLMALQELEKARLAERARKARQDGEPSPYRQNPPSEPDCHDGEETRRRKWRVF
jgi:hypothetical protein